MQAAVVQISTHGDPDVGHTHDDMPEGSEELFRNILIATFAEFCGTFMFLLLAFSATQIADIERLDVELDLGLDELDVESFERPNLPVLLFISLAFGVSLAAVVWVFYRVSGGMFNPVVRTPNQPNTSAHTI